MNTNLFPIAAVVAAVLLAFGCAPREQFTSENAPEKIVTEDFTPFYRGGPQQMGGPDASLRLDQRFKLLRREFGYSLVQLEDGRTGYVPNGSFAEAPPRQVFERVGDSPTPQRTFSDPSPAPREFAPPPDDFSLPDLESDETDIPPPVFIEDLDPERTPEFRL